MKPSIMESIDINTNEKVKKCPMTQEQKELLDKVLFEHQQRLNEFMIMSQQVSDLHIKWIDKRKELNVTDKKFKEKMRFIAKNLGLAEMEPWSYNISEKCFELREPPELHTFTGLSPNGA